MDRLVAIILFVLISLATLNVVGLIILDNNQCTHEQNSESVLLVIEGLRKAHPNANEICIVVAANIAVNNYEDVEHLMTAHGRCATQLLGLRVNPNEDK